MGRPVIFIGCWKAQRSIYLLLTTFAVFPSKCYCQDPVLIMRCSQISILLPFPSTAGSIIKVLYSYPWHSPIVEVIGGSHRPHGSLKWLLVPLILFMCHQDRCRMSLIKLRDSEKGRKKLIFFLLKGIRYQQHLSDSFRRGEGKRVRWEMLDNWELFTKDRRERSCNQQNPSPSCL